MSVPHSFSWDLYHETPIIGIIRGLGEELIYQIAETMLKANLGTVEITMNTPDAAKIITALVERFPGLNVGAGTVCNTSELASAIEAGAQFIVTPIIDEEVIRQCVAANIPVFPGGYTPTEIYKAWELGASGVKVFPASVLGPKYIKDVNAPLDQIKLIPTGGISVDNIKSYFAAGAYGVGMGSSLFLKSAIADLDFKSLYNHFVLINSSIESS